MHQVQYHEPFSIFTIVSNIFELFASKNYQNNLKDHYIH